MTENQAPSPLEELKNLLADLQAKRSMQELCCVTEGTRRALLQLDVTPREPDLATMERHLRAVYREELADLFEKACRRLLFENEVLAPAIYDDGSRSDGPVSKSEWGRLAERVLHAIPEGALEDEPLEVVRLLIDRTELSMAEVAQIGKGLRPLPAFDIYVGLDAMGSGKFDLAERVLSDAQRNAPFAGTQEDAVRNLGELAHMQGDLRTALIWYRRSSEGALPWSMSPVFWLFNAIQLGDRRECERASAALESCSPSGELIEDYVRRVRATRFDGHWAPSREARRVITSQAVKGNEVVDHVKELFT